MERLDATYITIYVEGKGAVLRERALLAFDAGTEKMLAFGTEAEGMASDSVKVVSPLQDGNIVAYYAVAVKLFRCLLQKAGVKSSLFHRPQIAVSMPGIFSDIEKKAVEDSLYQAGAGKVFLSEMELEQLAAHLRNSSERPLRNFQTIIGITEGLR